MIYLLLTSCALSFFNLLFVLFLSNAMFKFVSSIVEAQKEPLPIQREHKGLVDIKGVYNYDPRFKS